jgi:lipopolysaccharide/colanic/teichoic acid biosynthesis glycosyltransferase
MNVWAFVGSLVPAMLVAFAVGSRLSGNASPWLARTGFLVTASLAATALYWVYHRLDQTATTLVVVGSLAYLSVFTISTDRLVEDNAPPPPAIRDQIFALHAAAKLRYPRKPRGKRAFDVIAASVGFAVTAPLWLLIALLIWFEEPGPIFFTKNSVGCGGITFRELKFRSMHCEAERHTGPVVATFEDPRVLLVGRVTRRWHLDEMPELLNVLSGKMSVVGPRPLRAVVVRRALDEVPGFAERHTVRPGIACIAQIEKAHVEPAERLYKDLVYIQRMSVAFDVRLLVRAVVTTLRGEREPAPLPAVAIAGSRPGAYGVIDLAAGQPGRSDNWLNDALESVHPDAIRAADKFLPEAMERAAFHESGHALLGTLAAGADATLAGPIFPRGEAFDGTDQSQRTDLYGCSARWLRTWIVGALGGRAAEEIVYGNMAKGAEHELDQVGIIARQMVGGWYMSGAGAEPGHDSPGDIDRTAVANTTVVDDVARRIVDECYAQAIATLRERREQLDHLARALLDRDTLDELEAYATTGVRRPTPNAGSGTRG